MSCSKCRTKLPLSLPRVINFKFLLQPHQKFHITQHEKLGFHSLLRRKMIILPILTTSLIYFSLKGWENEFMNLGKGKALQTWMSTGAGASSATSHSTSRFCSRFPSRRCFSQKNGGLSRALRLWQESFAATDLSWVTASLHMEQSSPCRAIEFTRTNLMKQGKQWYQGGNYLV